MGEEFVYPIIEAEKSGDHLGIVISKTGDEQFHCGLAFHLQKGFHAIHLAWHHCLKYTSDTSEFTYWIKPNIHRIKQLVLSTKCSRINATKDTYKVPYALLYDGGAIFDDEGLFQLGGSMHGLTCATFVLAVFKSCGIDLVDLENWPIRDEDAKWHQSIIDTLKQYAKVSEAHLTNLQGEVGCARFRPEEVAMSSTFANMPEVFGEISRRGEDLRNKFSNN